ncbi:HAMP domain-containing histidine kinase [Paenibacillus doosanensis]|uniref:sensor histidine kinase n=1 Tax=Paenibacillus doosanensis TaxID=1229154 RepID=UPI0021806083|nr:HAMP domain-containing sensor histidine kinase [Paenibacillus doosanensis]MCS7461581.1 HAMP domain-containing histidine kinase [Paenibacillus doosanensis]
MKQKAIGSITRFIAPRSLRYQLLSRSLLILACLLLLIGFFQYLYMKQFIYKNKAESIHSQIMSIPREAWPMMGGNNNQGARRDPPMRLMFFSPDSSVAFIDTEGKYTLIVEPPDSGASVQLSQEEYENALQGKPDFRYLIVKGADGVEQLVVLQQINSRGKTTGLVQVSSWTAPMKEVLLGQLLTFIALATIALVFGLFTFLPVLKRTLVPLSKMVGTVERIDAGNLDERLPERQNQLEIDKLSLSFNHMLERLEASFEAEKEAKERMRRFIADASHELRTPLTSIHGFLEILLRGAASQPDQLHKALSSMYSESERINKLVQDLLLLARLDRSPTVQLEEGELDLVIQSMEPQLRLLAGERSVGFKLEPHMTCMFDQDKMKQVVLNLFHNAVQHTNPATGHIDVELGRVRGGVELTVRDNGSGIPEEHLPHLFDRFYRIDTSRARRYGGAGLGLSITKTIAEIHGGTIDVESEVGRGSAFRIWIPEHYEGQEEERAKEPEDGRA